MSEPIQPPPPQGPPAMPPSMPPMPPMPPAGNAAAMVNAPAIGLIVVGAIGALFAVWGLISGLLGIGGMDPAQIEQMREQMGEEFANAMQMMSGGGLSAFSSLITLATSALTIFGGLKMRNLTNRGLVLVASIIAMIPCVGPCCILGIPIGIWALVVINKPEVKAAFSS